MKNNKLHFVLMALVLVVFAMAGNSSDSWHGFNEGLEMAKESEKPTIIDFYTSWCHWCDVMDEKTFSDPEVKDFLEENFVTIRIDAENKNSSHTFNGQEYNSVELTRAFNVSGFPSLAFLDGQQNVVTVIPGYIPADKFIKILEYMDMECYKKQVSFEKYMEEGCNQEGE